MSVGPELLGQVLQKYGPALRLYAAQFCRAPDDAVQEALVQLARQREAPAHLAAWLYRTVRNSALTTARGAQRRARHEAQAAALRAEWFAASPRGEIDAAQAQAALEALPQAQREVLVARIWGELNYEQLAAVLGVSVSTAQRRYEAALAGLRERLEVVCRK